MKIFSLCTAEQRSMLEQYLRPSVPSDCTLIVEADAGRGGVWGTNEFSRVLERKAALMSRIIEENAGEIVVWADADVQFLGEDLVPALLHELGERDIACQMDYPGVCCAGFWVARSNERTRWLFRRVLEETLSSGNDQDALNRHRRRVESALLPADRFWTTRFGWRPGMSAHVPDNIVVHHANFTVGVENKLAILKRVRDEVRLRATLPAARRDELLRLKCLNIGCGMRCHPAWTNIDAAPRRCLGVRKHDARRRLPFGGDTFDLVYHSYLLGYLPRERAAPLLAECRRVLRPGGVLRVVEAEAGGAEADRAPLADTGRRLRGAFWVAVGERDPQPFIDGLRRRLPRRWQEEIHRRGPHSRKWLPGRETLLDLLKQAGFRDIRSRAARDSAVRDWKYFFLDTEPDGTPVRPSSVYLEAKA